MDPILFLVDNGFYVEIYFDYDESLYVASVTNSANIKYTLKRAETYISLKHKLEEFCDRQFG